MADYPNTTGELQAITTDSEVYSDPKPSNPPPHTRDEDLIERLKVFANHEANVGDPDGYAADARQAAERLQALSGEVASANAAADMIAEERERWKTASLLHAEASEINYANHQAAEAKLEAATSRSSRLEEALRLCQAVLAQFRNVDMGTSAAIIFAQIVEAETRARTALSSEQEGS